MELDELKSAWKALDGRIEETIKTQIALQDQMVMGRVEKSVGRFRGLPITDIVVGILTALWGGSLLGNNLSRLASEPLGAVPGLLIMLMGVFSVVVAVRELDLLDGMSYATPILECQRRLAKVRALRVRSSQWMFIVIFSIWPVFLITLAQSLIHYEVYRAFNAGWLAWNAVFGICVMGILVFFAKRSGGRSRFFRFIDDTLAGESLVRAQSFLREIDGFERD